MFSKASAFFINTRIGLLYPPTITDIGVANPNAQGQAIINCNRINESINYGWLRTKFCPNKKKVIETATTIGTKYFAILSANFVSVLWSDWLN
jgi:hypothetical protein